MITLKLVVTSTRFNEFISLFKEICGAYTDCCEVPTPN